MWRRDIGPVLLVGGRSAMARDLSALLRMSETVGRYDDRLRQLQKHLLRTRLPQVN